MADYYFFAKLGITLFISNNALGDTRKRLEYYLQQKINDSVVLIVDTNPVDDCYDYSDLSTWDIDHSKVISGAYWDGDIREYDLYNVALAFSKCSSVPVKWASL